MLQDPEESSSIEQVKGSDRNSQPPCSHQDYYENEFERGISVYRKCRDAVVHISVQTNRDTDVPIYPEGQEPRLVPALGSGVVIDAEEGLIVTNLHVISNAHEMKVKFANGIELDAEVIGIEPGLDLAVLKLKDPPKGLKAVEISESAGLPPGKRVYALGNPHGLDGTITEGVVSGPPRNIKSSSTNSLYGMIQTDAAINPGNSGGALLDAEGRLIGINTMIFTASGGSDGLGFAVPIKPIIRAMKEMVSHGYTSSIDLGCNFIDTPNGPAVGNVRPESSVDAAGVNAAMLRREKRGVSYIYVLPAEEATYLESVNGKKINNTDELGAMLQDLDVDKPMALTFREGLSGKKINVILVPRKLRQPPDMMLGEGSLDLDGPDESKPVRGIVY